MPNAEPKTCDSRLDPLLGPNAAAKRHLAFRAPVVDATSRHRQFGEQEQTGELKTGVPDGANALSASPRLWWRPHEIASVPGQVARSFANSPFPVLAEGLGTKILPGWDDAVSNMTRLSSGT
jgi:hypothetical protein